MSYRNKYMKWVAAMFAAVLMFLPGCIKESPVDDYLPAGSTVLRISTKGIAVDSEASNVDWEVYVKTLRLIGFQEGNKVLDAVINFEDESVMKKYPVLGTGEKAYIEIPLKDLGATIKRGTLDLYAVANEEAGELAGDKSLDNISSMSELEGLMVTDNNPYPAPSAENPFLMSAHVNTTLIAPDNNKITIELRRTVGKVMLESVTFDDGTNKRILDKSEYNYTLEASGNIYESYPLFEGTNKASSKLTNLSSKNAPLYLSESNGELDIKVSVEYNGTTYVNKEDIDKINEIITRNKCVNIKATINKKDETSCLQLDISVAEWEAVPLNPSYE